MLLCLSREDSLNHSQLNSFDRVESKLIAARQRRPYGKRDEANQFIETVLM